MLSNIYYKLLYIEININYIKDGYKDTTEPIQNLWFKSYLFIYDIKRYYIYLNNKE